MNMEPITTKRIAILSKGEITNVKLDGINAMIKKELVNNCIVKIGFFKKNKTALIIELDDISHAKLVYNILDGQEISGNFLECYFMDENMDLGSELVVTDTENTAEAKSKPSKKSERKKLRKEKTKQSILERLAKKHDDGFVFNPDDSRFDRIYTDPDFYIDTTHPLYENNKGAEMILKKMDKNNI